MMPNLPSMVRAGASAVLPPGAPWTQVGASWTAAGPNAISNGTAALAPDKLYGPILPDADCNWFVRISGGHPALIPSLLGVARSDSLPPQFRGAGGCGTYWSGGLERDGTLAGAGYPVGTALFRLGVNKAAGRLYIAKIGVGGPVWVNLPAGYSSDQLVPLLHAQTGYPPPSAFLFAAQPGSGGLF